MARAFSTRSAARLVGLFVRCSAVLVVLLAASSATASTTETIPRIEITQAGPNRSIPVRTAFKLHGKVDATTVRVTPVFIRYMFRPWGINPLRNDKRVPRGGSARPSGCAEILEVLEGHDDDAKLLRRSQLQRGDLAPGEHDVDDIWFAPAANPEGDEKVFEYLSRHARVFIPRPWEELPATDGQKRDFELLVAQPSFFRPGARYCMLLYYDVAKVADVTAEVKRAIMVAASRRETTCSKTDLGCPAQDGPKKCDRPDGSRNCLEPRLRTILQGSTGVQTLIDKVRESLLGNAIDLRFHGYRVAILLESIKEFVQPWSPPAEAVSVDDPLGQFLMEALAYHGAVRVVQPTAATAPDPAPEKPKKKKKGATAPAKPEPAPKRTYFFNEFQVHEVRVVGTAPKIELLADSKDADPNKRAVLSVDLHTLQLPGGEVSLREILEFAQRRIVVGTEALDQRALAALATEAITLEAVAHDTPIGQVPAHALDPPDLAQARELSEHVAALEELVDDALEADAKTSSGSPGGRDERLLRTLGAWLRHDVLAPCSQAATVATQRMLTCSTDDTPWPGYGKGDDPLSTLAGDLSTYVTAGTDWTDDQVVLKKKALDKADRDPVTFSVSLSTDLKQTSWLSSYITPFFGYSGVFTGAESFGLPYGGVQVYLWPNEVHEPMWINGGVDARRLFAFEVGLGAPAVTPQAFGPGDRYRYFDSGFPPVMTGLAIQPFAYTTFSAGLSFMRQVRSPVATEVHQPVRSFYLSVALDINVFNFIRQRITGFPSSVPETKHISR